MSEEQTHLRLMAFFMRSATAEVQNALATFAAECDWICDSSGIGPVGALVQRVPADHQPALAEIQATNKHLVALLTTMPLVPLAYGKPITFAEAKSLLADIDPDKISKIGALLEGKAELGINILRGKAPTEPEELEASPSNYLRFIQSERKAHMVSQQRFSKTIDQGLEAALVPYGVLAHKALEVKDNKLLYQGSLLINVSTFDREKIQSKLSEIVLVEETSVLLTGPFAPFSFVDTV